MSWVTSLASGAALGTVLVLMKFVSDQNKQVEQLQSRLASFEHPASILPKPQDPTYRAFYVAGLSCSLEAMSCSPNPDGTHQCSFHCRRVQE